MRMIAKTLAAIGFVGAMAVTAPSPTLAQGFYFQGPGVEFGHASVVDFDPTGAPQTKVGATNSTDKTESFTVTAALLDGTLMTMGCDLPECLSLSSGASHR